MAKAYDNITCKMCLHHVYRILEIMQLCSDYISHQLIIIDNTRTRLRQVCSDLVHAGHATQLLLLHTSISFKNF